MRNLAIMLFVVLAACDDSGPEDFDDCHFESGRPCPADTVCLGEQGNDCNYFSCVDGHLEGTAIGCSVEEPGEIPPVAGGPFECNPETIVRDPTEAAFTPPNGPCGPGSMHMVVDNFWGACVPLEQCNPIPCDPQWLGDGCPTTYACDADSRTCVPRVAD